MAILNFDQTPAQAFGRGFLKGLAAPVELFRADHLPAAAEPVIIEVPTLSVQQALASDWAAVGSDIRAAIKHHEQSEAVSSARKPGK